MAVICPRQNGKGNVLEAVELAGLFLFDEKLILHSAHQFKTATDAFRRLWELIESTPDLDRQVYRKLQNNNDMSIELKSGQRIQFVARSRTAARGFSGDRVILDEAFELHERTISSMAFTMGARPNAQIWFTSSAPLPEEKSDVLRRICRRGRDGDERLVYFEWCADPDANLDDREAWAAANPGYPHLIGDEAILTERGVSMDEDFARERLGVWHDDDNRPVAIPPDDWYGCEDARSTALDPLFFAVDVAPDRASAAIGFAGLRRDGRVHFEATDNRRGTGWVVDRLAALCRESNVKTVTLAPSSPAGSLQNDLGLAGLEVNPCSTQESTAACGAFYDGLMTRRYLHIGQPYLTSAVDGAQRRRIGEAWVWDRITSLNDVTPLVACTLAAWSLHQHLPETERRVFGAWR